MPLSYGILIHAVLVFYASLWASVHAADEAVIGTIGVRRKGYAKGEPVAVSCLNRTM